MWLYGYEPIKVNYHPTKFGGHSQSGSRLEWSDFNGPWIGNILEISGKTQNPTKY